MSQSWIFYWLTMLFCCIHQITSRPINIHIIVLQLHFHFFPSVCEKRQWKCTQRVCDGVCRVIGETHYISFDGLKFSFPGPCQYVLAQVKSIFSLSCSLFSSVPHIHSCFLLFVCVRLSRITATDWMARSGFWWRTPLVGSQVTAAVKASQ